IKELTKMPLVLHGGSGSGDKNIENCVKYGINKINVGCDFMNANVDSIKKHLEKDPNINYWVMMHQVEIDSREIIRHYIRLSKSEGKSL
ncbi:MAG TPA: fructose-bisphosphate aldolase, partial [Erysipelotrichaceae bacterium]|nr:fructose-bisphosphate aldolase [Erysipelotrichaceae bacterium]